MSAIARGFDRLAPIYDFLARAVYGNSLRKAQSVFLNQIKKNGRVLVVGGGSGWFLEQLIRVANPAEIFYVEISPKMIAASKARIQSNLPDYDIQRVSFIQGELKDLPQTAGFDSICTHCFLDLFGPEQLAHTVKQLKGHLNLGGKWYFSDFNVPERFPMRTISKLLIKVMYLFFNWTCSIDARQLPAFDKHFSENGLSATTSASFFGGMIVAKLLVKGEAV